MKRLASLPTASCAAIENSWLNIEVPGLADKLSGHESEEESCDSKETSSTIVQNAVG